MKRRSETVNLEVDVDTVAYVDIDPEEYPELVEWADHRAASGPPSLALDTLWMAHDRLKILAQCPASDSLDRGEIDRLADELHEVWQRIVFTPSVA